MQACLLYNSDLRNGHRRRQYTGLQLQEDSAD